MILTLLIWKYMAFTFIGLGYLTLQFIPANTSKRQLPLEVVIFIGYASVICITSLAYFFTPLNQWVHLGITAVAGFGFLKHFGLIKTQLKEATTIFQNLVWHHKALLGLGIISTFIHTIGTIQNVDSGNYHAQSILWMNEYAIVPGLGNLLGNLAYNQSSFLAEAHFSLQPFGANSFSVLNGFLTVCLLGYLFLTPKKNTSNWMAIVFTIPLFLYYHQWFSSPSPDVPIALLTYLCIAFIANQTANQGQFDRSSLFVIYYLAITAITIKLSAFTIPLLGLCILVAYPKNLKIIPWPTFITLGLVILSAWIVRFYIFSGYLIFPLPITGWFSPDWKVPLFYTQAIKDAIHGFSIHPFVPSPQVMKMGVIDKFNLWVSYQGVPHVILTFLAIILPVITYFKKKKQEYFPIQFALWMGVLLWLYLAPDFRFGSPLVYASLFFAVIQWKVQWHVKQTQVLTLMLSVMAVVAMIRNLHPEDVVSQWYAPKKYPAKEVITQPGRNFDCYQPVAPSQCWDQDLPCIPMGFLPYIELRGNTLQEGFRFAELPQRQGT